MTTNQLILNETKKNYEAAAPNFLDALQAELVKRCKANPKYSLRSFASALDVSPSFLSKLLSGKRPLTETTFRKLIRKLSLNPQDVATFSQRFEDKSKLPLSQAYRQIQLDQFEFISEWYHFAILELFTFANFKEDPQWIAKQLNINFHQANDALDRLLRLGYLDRKKNKLTLKKKHNTTIGPELVVPATLRQQTQFLQKAIEAMQNIPIEQRSQTSMTMAIPQSKVPEAQKLIQTFRRGLTGLMQKSDKPDSVYQLVISFYPLTQV